MLATHRNKGENIQDLIKNKAIFKRFNIVSENVVAAAIG